MKRMAVLGSLFVALAACTDGSALPTPAPTPGGKLYHDPAGWTVDVPSGWHVLAFETSEGNARATGAQISNVELPSPSIVPGFPMQTTGKDLPAHVIALIIAIDDDPTDVQQPPATPTSLPLSFDEFDQGSCTGDADCFSLLWFSANGQTFLATTKIGPDATDADRATLAAVVASLRFDAGAS